MLIRRMFTTISLFICAFLLSASALPDESPTNRLAAVRAELRTVLAEARTAPETVRLGVAAERAREALERAERETPGIAELDAQMTEVRDTLRALQRQRNAKLRANAPELDAKRAARESAARAYGEARRGGERGNALLRERNALMRLLYPVQVPLLPRELEHPPSERN